MFKEGLKAIDFFCGAGGLSLGFNNAGIDILAGIDKDIEALETYSFNLAKSKAINHDLNNISSKFLDSFKNVDIVLGGPPCQGFSIAGKRETDDPRNFLVSKYLEYIKLICPSAVVIENVPNILNLGKGKFANEIVSGLKELGFLVEVCKINSVDYGVPQTRKRIFFIGMKKIKGSVESVIKQKKILTPITTYEAISDLPELDDDCGTPQSNYDKSPTTQYQKYMRTDSPILHNHVAVSHKPETKNIISMVPDGGNYKDLPTEYQSTRKVNIAWTRMNSKKPCFTIDAGHNHHFHYKANRVPTVRECARIQSFPDSFVFKGKKTSQFRQVGNAVPPLVAEKIAESILEILVK